MRNITVFIIYILVIAGCAQKEIILEFKPVVGSRYSGKMSVDNSVKQKETGQEVALTQKFTAGFSFSVIEAVGGDRRLEVSYEALSMTVKTPLAVFEYDTKSKKGNAELAVLDELIGKPFILLVSPSGKIVSVERVNIILNSIIKKKNVTQQAVTLLLGILEEKRVKESFKSLFNYFPGGPVKRGDSWKIADNIDRDNMKLKAENSWKLEKAGKNSVVLGLSSKIDGDDPRVAVKGTQEGTFVINLESGMPVEGDISQHMKGTVTTGEDVEWKMEMRGTVRMVLTAD